MTIRTCPACQARYRAPDGVLAGYSLCPDCRFQARLRTLKRQGFSLAAPDMIACECPICRLKFQVPGALVGTERCCPDCSHPVRVLFPNKGSVGLWVTILAVLVLGVIAFAISSILGKNSNTAFGTVSGGLMPTVTAT